MLRAQKDEMEKRDYSMKHELISLQRSRRRPERGLAGENTGCPRECDCKYVRICSRWMLAAGGSGYVEGEDMKNRMVEILAPAGSYESMVAAVNAGADASTSAEARFGARAYADNLDEETMVKAIDFMHLHGCRIYMTVNTLVKEKEMWDLYSYLKPYYEAGLDAVLVQDIGATHLYPKHFPDLPGAYQYPDDRDGKVQREGLKVVRRCPRGPGERAFTEGDPRDL